MAGDTKATPDPQPRHGGRGLVMVWVLRVATLLVFLWVFWTGVQTLDVGRILLAVGVLIVGALLIAAVPTGRQMVAEEFARDATNAQERVEASREPFRSAQPVVVRTYPGRNQADAVAAFQAEASAVAPMGYIPVSQSWAEGVSGKLKVIAFGELERAARPVGSLVVTYQRQPSPSEE